MPELNTCGPHPADHVVLPQRTCVIELRVFFVRFQICFVLAHTSAYHVNVPCVPQRWNYNLIHRADISYPQPHIPLLVRFTNHLTPHLVFTLRSIDYFASMTTTIPPGVDLAADRGPNVLRTTAAVVTLATLIVVGRLISRNPSGTHLITRVFSGS